jgi:hypothetical protein
MTTKKIQEKHYGELLMRWYTALLFYKFHSLRPMFCEEQDGVE